MSIQTDLIRQTDRLPTGTVTFLFTDIERSTELLQTLGEKYARVLADQRQILRNAFDRWGGQEVDTQGDAFFLAFSQASDALFAVVEAQRCLMVHPWPDGQEVRVRMALHTGEANLTEEGYVGMDIHRAARICSAGHGCQVLLSPSTCALVERNLSDGLRIQDLGEHRLKDLRLPIRIYQLVIPGLPSDFPALKTLSALPNNLPVQISTFIGRQTEIGKIKEKLVKQRWVTLTGPGGAGKSRLSLQVAAEMVEEFPHGVWFVSLENVDIVEEIAPAIAEALRFKIDMHSNDLDANHQIKDFLSKKSLLLVLDNFEHLMDGAGLLKEILVTAPEVKLLLTSRERVNLPGEWVYPLSGLEMPDNNLVTDLDNYSALALLNERARQANPDFSLSPSEISCASRICRAVGGMPLGIELAAPWTTMLTCKEIADEIEQNLDFLTDTLRGMPTGHRSLRAVFDHSWRLLSDEQRSAFSKLSVFRGGFDRLTATNAVGVRLDVLMELVKKSLVQRTDQGRFNLHPMLHQFAAEKIAENPDVDNAVHADHSRYYIDYMEHWLRSEASESEQKIHQMVTVEVSNIRSAIEWALLHLDEDLALEVLRHSDRFYLFLGEYEAAIAYDDLACYLRANGAALEEGEPMRRLLLSAMVSHAAFLVNFDDVKAEQIATEYLPILRNLDMQNELGSCLFVRGICAEIRGEYLEAIQLLEESAELLRTAQAYNTLTSCLLWLGWAYYELGDFQAAEKHFKEAYQITLRDRLGLLRPYALSKLGTWADALGNFEQGFKYHQEALKSFEMLNDQSGMGYAYLRMSHSARGLGDFRAAEQYGQQGYEHFKAVGHRWGAATSLCRIGFAELGLNKLPEAQHLFHQGLQLSLEYQYKATAMYALIGLASLWHVDGDFGKSVEVLSFAIDNPITPALYKDIALNELEMLQSKLTESEFDEGQQIGRAMEFDKLVVEVLENWSA